jgi:predicted SAM-dependent methyltransferase
LIDTGFNHPILEGEMKRKLNSTLLIRRIRGLLGFHRKSILHVKKPAEVRNLMIGGGDRDYGLDWHNLEFVTAGFSSRYVNLNKTTDLPHDLSKISKFGIDSNSVEVAYSCHVIEHLKDELVMHIFEECYRILELGGTLRIVCPDIDLYVRALEDDDLDFFHYRMHPHYVNLGIQNSVAGLFLDVFATSLGVGNMSKKTRTELLHELNQLGKESFLEKYSSQTEYSYDFAHFHINWFNNTKLSEMLTKAGFETCYPSRLGQSRKPILRDLSLIDNADPKISLYFEAIKG